MRHAFTVFRLLTLISNAVIACGALVLIGGALLPNDVDTSPALFGGLIAAAYCGFNMYVAGWRKEAAYPVLAVASVICSSSAVLWWLGEFIAMPALFPPFWSCLGFGWSLPALAMLFCHRYSSRPFQFSLRRLLFATIGIAAAGTVFSTLIAYPRWQRRVHQRAAIVQLERIVNGPYPENCYRYDNWWVTYVWLKDVKVTDHDLEVIANGFPKLTFLSLENTRVTDEGMKHLAQLKELQTLCLDGCAISDDGLKHLESMRNLTFVGLLKTQTTAGGVRRLGGALPAASLSNGKTRIEHGVEVPVQ